MELNKINKLNSEKIIADNVKNAIDDGYKYKLKSIKIKKIDKLIKKNTKRKKELRVKYKCILESDIIYLVDIFNKIRKYFYGIPMGNNSTFIDGKLYINCLPPRGHKTYKLSIVNFRFESDLEYVNDIKMLLESHGFMCFVETRCF